MKNMTGLTAIAGLLLPVALVGQDFEGSVTYRMEGRGQNGQIVHHVKDGNARMEFSANGQTMAMITNFDASKIILLMPSEKQWIDMKAMQERMAGMMGNAMGGAAEASASDPADFDIVPTGQKETIAGHECEHYIYKSDDSEVDVCAAKGMGWYFGAGSASATMGGLGALMGRGRGNQSIGGVPGLTNAQMEKWRSLYKDGFFPLKVTSTGPQGGISLVVTNIEKKSLPASLFAPPADYTEMKMPGGN